MASWVQIANLALTHLGAERIASLADDTAPARAVAACYEPIRDAVLRDHPWNCALTTALIAADADPPTFGFARGYTLPSDPWCLRPWQVWEAAVPWVVRGRRLFTDREPPLPLVYIARVTDPELFDPALTVALAARLAHTIAFQLVQSRDKEDQMWALYERLLRAARSLDAVEGTPQPGPSSTFVRARYR
jgi:hypothetical protein